MSDSVNNPKHYCSHQSGVECIEIAEMLPFNLGNALKYLWRAGKKLDEVEDIQKAVFYLRRQANSQNALRTYLVSYSHLKIYEKIMVVEKADPQLSYLIKEIVYGCGESLLLLADRIEIEYGLKI